MPQIQVLPTNPSFGTQLAHVLGEFGGNVGQGLVQRGTNTRISSLLKQLQDPNTTQMQKIPIATQIAQLMGPEQAKAMMPMYAPLIFGQGGGAQQTSGAPQQAGQPQGMMEGAPPAAQQGMYQQPNAQANSQSYDKEYLQNMAGNPIYGEIAKEKLADMRAQEKLVGQEDREIRKESREEIRKFAEPYGDLESLRANVNRLKEAQKLIEGGNVSFDENKFRNAWVAYLEGDDNPMSEIFQTDDQQKLWYLMKDSLKSKEQFGSNPSTKEVMLGKTALANPYKGRLANEYILEQMVHGAEVDLKKGEKIYELKRKSPKLDAAEFRGLVDEDVGKFSKENLKALNERLTKKEGALKVVGKSPPPGTVWMMSPDGKVGSVPKDKIEEAKANGYGDI